MTRSNEEWIAELSSSGPNQDSALQDLRGIIRKGLPFALSKYLSPQDPNFDALTEEVVQDTLLRVLDNLQSFEGRSKFTTWVHKIAVRVALTELRRKRWEDVSLDAITANAEAPAITAAPGVGPEQAAVQVDALERIEQIIAEELTERQRRALIAIAVHGMPMPVVADRMDMNQNALYKLLHDARLKLKDRLAREGLSAGDVLALFEGS